MEEAAGEAEKKDRSARDCELRSEVVRRERQLGEVGKKVRWARGVEP